jgi:hypothetical protein
MIPVRSRAKQSRAEHSVQYETSSKSKSDSAPSAVPESRERKEEQGGTSGRPELCQSE